MDKLRKIQIALTIAGIVCSAICVFISTNAPLGWACSVAWAFGLLCEQLTKK